MNVDKDRPTYRSVFILFVTMNLDKENITDAAIAEISRQAASAYSEDGASLYDAIRVTTRDESAIYQYYDEALSHMNARFKGRVPCSNNSLAIPFADSIASEADVRELVESFLNSYICAEWFRRRYVQKYEEYKNYATADLEKLVVLVMTRKQPSKGGITL